MLALAQCTQWTNGEYFLLGVKNFDWHFFLSAFFYFNYKVFGHREAHYWPLSPVYKEYWRSLCSSCTSSLVVLFVSANRDAASHDIQKQNQTRNKQKKRTIINELSLPLFGVNKLLKTLSHQHSVDLIKWLNKRSTHAHDTQRRSQIKF